MKRIFYLALVALVAVAFSSCSLMGKKGEPQFNLGDLQGYWQENNTQHFIHFTTEKSDENPYLYGYEWDVKDDVTEQDVLADKYGNGWFKYWFETEKGGLHELHLMTNGGAEIPKEYIVTVLTGTKMEYYEQGRPNTKYYFSKIEKN
jgi:hypothetical protein